MYPSPAAIWVSVMMKGIFSLFLFWGLTGVRRKYIIIQSNWLKWIVRAVDVSLFFLLWYLWSRGFTN